MATCRRVKFLCRMFSVLVIRLRSLRLLRVSGIVMRLRMFLLLITFLKASHSFRNQIGRASCRERGSVSAFLLNRSSDLKGALTYTDIAGDPVLYGNLPPREISMKDVFRSGDSSKKFKIAEGQWYRYAPSYVSPAYHLLEGFPFIQEPPSGDLQER